MLYDQDVLSRRTPEEKAGTRETAPNAWRILDSYGEHVATVYDKESLAAYLSRDGYSALPVRIKDPRW